MSLKFGIYLVEQRIISPEQFCGLVKIQQEATMSLATIAIRKNLLTIREVATILDVQEVHPGKSFVQIALENDFLDRADAEQLLHFQQLSCLSIQHLAIECGLITRSQANALQRHFSRDRNQTVEPVETTPERPPSSRPRQPKFKQRPVVVRQEQDG